MIKRRLFSSFIKPPPGPIPLPPAQQKDFQKLIEKEERRVQIESLNKISKESEFEPFPDHKNPSTGEINGPTGPEPTRFGDWERKGRVTDF